MITTEFAIALLVGGLAIALAIYGRHRQNGALETTLNLQATAKFLLEQNQLMSARMDILRVENDALHSEIRQLRLDLGDARTLLRNIQPRP